MKHAVLVGVVVGLGVSAAHGAASPRILDCARIEDADRRLACFDELFPSAELEDTAEESNSPVSAGEPTSSAAPVPPAPQESGKPEAVVDGASTNAGSRTWFGGREGDLTSTIVAIRRSDKQKMLFQLANDQVWMQATPRPLPFRVGDTVIIKSALLGGYFMSASSGTSTRVQRIQ